MKIEGGEEEKPSVTGAQVKTEAGEEKKAGKHIRFDDDGPPAKQSKTED